MASLAELAAAKGKTVENNTLAQIRVQQIHYTKLKPSERNFYGQREIDEMTDSIALAGIIQPLIVRKTDMGEYEVIVGHRRRLGAIANIERGIKECEFLPCIEIKASDRIIQEIKELSNMTDREAEEIYTRYILIASNSTGRELTNYERMEQAMELKEIIPFMRGDAGLKGRALRTEIAKEMKCSNGTVGTYETIYNNLIPKAMEKFKADEIGISMAAALAGLPKHQQEELVDREDLTIADIKALKDQEQIPGQMNIEDILQNEPENTATVAEETVSESDTEESAPALGNTKAEEDFEDVKKELVSIPLIADNIEQAIELIFNPSSSKDFPYEEFEEIIDLFKQGENGHTGYISQQLIFDKQLPFENEFIRVKYECGYRIEFKHTDEYMQIPIYHFWRGFEKKYNWMWEKESEKETVSETDTEESTSENSNQELVSENNIKETVSESDTEQQEIYTEFVVKTFKQSAWVPHKECETQEEMFKYIQEITAKHDDIVQIVIVLGKGIS